MPDFLGAPFFNWIFLVKWISMEKLSTFRNEHASIYAVWLGIAAVILIAMLGTTASTRTVSATDLDRADLDFVHCVSSGVELTWRTENEGRAVPPDGWKVERSHQITEGNQVVQTFTFMGDDADALLMSSGEFWKWVDTGAQPNVLYTYRVRAINADGSRHGR